MLWTSWIIWCIYEIWRYVRHCRCWFGSRESVDVAWRYLLNSNYERYFRTRKSKRTKTNHRSYSFEKNSNVSGFFYEIKRFDIKVKEFLRTLGKYYIVAIGLRNYLLGFIDRDNGHAIENVVYFELLRIGYDVSIGKIDNTEVDFIATKADKKVYFLSFKIKDECDAIIWRLLY